MTSPNTPATLAPLLRRLRAEAYTAIVQHEHDPQPDEWFAGREQGGDFGPYDTAETAVVSLVRNLWLNLDEAREQRDFAEKEVQQLRTELAAMRQRAGTLAAELLHLANAGGQG